MQLMKISKTTGVTTPIIIINSTITEVTFLQIIMLATIIKLQIIIPHKIRKIHRDSAFIVQIKCLEMDLCSVDLKLFRYDCQGTKIIWKFEKTNGVVEF